MNFESSRVRPQSDAQVASREKIAEQLRDFRRKERLSLEELALRSGVSRSMISKIERGEAVPTTTTLSRLAEAFGITFSRLIATEEESEVLVIPAHRQPHSAR